MPITRRIVTVDQQDDQPDAGQVPVATGDGSARWGRGWAEQVTTESDSAPPVDVYTEDGTAWVYTEVTV